MILKFSKLLNSVEFSEVKTDEFFVLFVWDSEKELNPQLYQKKAGRVIVGIDEKGCRLLLENGGFSGDTLVHPIASDNISILINY